MPHSVLPFPSRVAHTRLVAGLNGDESALSALYTETKHRLTARVRRTAPDLSADLAEDAVAETWLIVLERGAGTVVRAGVDDYLYLVRVLKHAVRRVRSANRIPGTKSRGGFVKRSIQLDQSNLEHQTAEASLSVERFNNEREAEDAQERLGHALAQAAPRVQTAAHLMLVREMSISEAAREVEMNRMTLTRALAALGDAA